MFVSGPEQQEQSLAVAVHTGVELRIAAALRLPKRPLFSRLRMPAGILMDLDVSGVDHLERAGFLLLRMDRQQLAEDAPARPAQVESIDAVPFSISLGKLVPDASRDEDPPDPVQSFSKIGRMTALF